MLHQEGNGIATFATAEAFEDLLRGGNREGRRALVMKRAKAEIIGAAFFQLYKTTHHIQDIDTGKDLLYGVLRDHAPANIGGAKECKLSGLKKLISFSG